MRPRRKPRLRRLPCVFQSPCLWLRSFLTSSPSPKPGRSSLSRILPLSSPSSSRTFGTSFFSLLFAISTSARLSLSLWSFVNLRRSIGSQSTFLPSFLPLHDIHLDHGVASASRARPVLGHKRRRRVLDGRDRPPWNITLSSRRYQLPSIPQCQILRRRRGWRYVSSISSKCTLLISIILVADDTAAINAAISAGKRCNPSECRGSVVSPATVYFPSGSVAPEFVRNTSGQANLKPQHVSRLRFHH